MTSGPTVVMYSPDTIGLGHVRRHSMIAAELVAVESRANVVMLIGTGNGAFFDLPQGVDSIKMPCVQKTGKDTWRARSLDFSRETTQRIRSGLIRETLDTLRPDVFLVDHLPAGIWRELETVLRFLREHSPHTKIVLGLRDILDDEHEVRRRWKADGTYDLIRDYYDSIFIYGDRTIYHSAEHYGLTDEICDDIRYIGYIGPNTAASPATKPTTDLPGLARTPESKLLVATAGGGYDAFPMMSSILAGLAEMPRKDKPDAVLITGPLMPSEHRAQLTEHAIRQGVQVIPFTNNMKAYLAAADLIVTMGGYNSMIETMATGKPTINIPRSGPSQEQTIRAGLFHQMGLLHHVPLAAADAKRIANAIALEIKKPLRASSPQLTLDGARRAAKCLARMFRGQRGVIRHDCARHDLQSQGRPLHVAAS